MLLQLISSRGGSKQLQRLFLCGLLKYMNIGLHRDYTSPHSTCTSKTEMKAHEPADWRHVHIKKSIMMTDSLMNKSILRISVLQSAPAAFGMNL